MLNQEKEKRLILCALPYANNVPHVGNIVGSHLPADIFARYCRLNGYEAILIGGTDENGTPTEVAAREACVTPQKLVDEFHKIQKAIYDWFLISYDNFSRTSKPIHHKTTKALFTEIYNKGYIIEKEIKVPFCKKCSMALPDRYVQGTCPNCGYDKARGDQCDKCTKLLDPVDLKKPKCKICGTEPKPKKTKHLFLDFSKLQSELETWIKSNTHWSEQVTSLALGWIHEGLKPRCITRDLKFGVQVPIPGYEEKIFYVWFDAPIGYVSSTKEWAEGTKHPDSWELYWKNPESRIYNFMGKDNIPFHTIFWPAMLIAYGKYNLPYQVVGLQFCNYEGDKISKSRNWGVFCERLPESGIEPDIWRYYLSHLIPETKDSDFKWDEFQSRVNNELIGNLGNFVNRTLSFIVTNMGRKLDHHDLNSQDTSLIKNMENSHRKRTDLFEKLKLREALQKIMDISREGNRYLQENRPWELIKTDQKRCETVLYLSANLCLNLAILIQPFLPNTSKKIFDQLGVKDKFVWNDAKKINLQKGQMISRSEILFKPIEKGQIEELKNIVTKPTPLEDIFNSTPGEKSLSSENIFPLDLRVGLVESAEDHPNADKLFVLHVNFGKEKRQILSGLKPYGYTNDDLKGRKVVAVLNLKPADIRGMKSNGMILTGEDKTNLGLLRPKKSDIGEQVAPDGFTQQIKELGIGEFSKLDLLVKDGKATFEGRPLKTKHEIIEVEKVKEGKIR